MLTITIPIWLAILLGVPLTLAVFFAVMLLVGAALGLTGARREP